MKTLNKIKSKLNHHFITSLCKSAMRILAGIALYDGFLVPSAIFFITAEVLGIVEEF